MARPPHATWYVRRVSLPPALQALTCRLGAPAHLCDEHAFSYPGRFRWGNAPTLYNAFWILDATTAPGGELILGSLSLYKCARTTWPLRIMTPQLALVTNGRYRRYIP